MTSKQSYLDETTPLVRESIVPLLRKSSKNTFVAPQPKVIKKLLITFMNGKFVHVYHQNEIIRELVVKYGVINVEENFKNPVDNVICHDVFVDNFKRKLTNVRDTVNKAWLDDCIAKNMCVGIQEHHKIIKDSQVKSNILKGEKFCSSNYSNVQKTFIAGIVKRLGEDFNECFKKSESPILISPTSKGAKYESVIEWKRVLPDYNSPDPRLNFKSRLIRRVENSIEATNFIPNSEETEKNQNQSSLILQISNKLKFFYLFLSLFFFHFNSRNKTQL
jgi:hypothetical protein